MPPTNTPAATPAGPEPGPGGDALAGRALRTVHRAGLTLATAESLTGGALASSLVSVPGASSVYVGGVVAYAVRLKTTLLGVPPELLDAHGAVSEECARAMAEGARSRLEADVALSTTGVAGPDAQDGQPAGTVFVACATAGETQVRRLLLDGDRAEVRSQSVEQALGLLLALVQAGVPQNADRPRPVGAGG